MHVECISRREPADESPRDDEGSRARYASELHQPAGVVRIVKIGPGPSIAEYQAADLRRAVA
jgi:hypothetical protein